MLLKDRTTVAWISFTGLSPSLAPLSSGFYYPYYSILSALQHHVQCACAHECGLGFSLFARRYWGNNFCSLFLALLRCFSSGCTLLLPMNSVKDIHKWIGFPIRKSSDQSFLAAPRSLSQPNTSFVGTFDQGIHRMH